MVQPPDAPFPVGASVQLVTVPKGQAARHVGDFGTVVEVGGPWAAVSVLWARDGGRAWVHPRHLQAAALGAGSGGAAASTALRRPRAGGMGHG